MTDIGTPCCTAADHSDGNRHDNLTHAIRARLAEVEAERDEARTVGFDAGVSWADNQWRAAHATEEARGYDRAIANLRDGCAYAEWKAQLPKRSKYTSPAYVSHADAGDAADYLEARKETANEY